jgi:PAS domain-containing protein
MIMPQDSHTQSPISQIGDMLDDGLILTDLDGVILSVNPAAVRWFGENLTGQKIFDMINHPNIGELFAKAAGVAFFYRAFQKMLYHYVRQSLDISQIMKNWICNGYNSRNITNRFSR